MYIDEHRSAADDPGRDFSVSLALIPLESICKLLQMAALQSVEFDFSRRRKRKIKLSSQAAFPLTIAGAFNHWTATEI